MMMREQDVDGAGDGEQKRGWSDGRDVNEEESWQSLMEVVEEVEME